VRKKYSHAALDNIMRHRSKEICGLQVDPLSYVYTFLLLFKCIHNSCKSFLMFIVMVAVEAYLGVIVISLFSLLDAVEKF